MTSLARTLYIIVCGAGPASQVDRLVKIAQADNWDVCIISTPAGLDFIDSEALEKITSHPIRSQYRKPGQPRSPKADAIIVAPATFNSINKWAAGISDTYALGILAEAPSLRIPIIVLPFVNTALAGRVAFQRSIDLLRTEGVQVLIGPSGVEPHAPGSGDSQLASFPWQRALAEVDQATNSNR